SVDGSTCACCHDEGIGLDVVRQDELEALRDAAELRVDAHCGLKRRPERPCLAVNLDVNLIVHGEAPQPSSSTIVIGSVSTPSVTVEPKTSLGPPMLRSRPMTLALK